MVLRNFNLPKSGDASTIDFLHEPGISIQVSPKQAPEPVLQAALSAMNLHLQRHGKDLVEISVGPQASAGGGEKPSVGAQAQAQIHVSTTFSITAATSVAAAAPGEESKPGTKVDITWSPMSIGALYKLGEKDPAREKGEGSEFYKALTPGKDVISWVAGQLDPAEFAAPGKEGLHVNKLVTDMFDAMLAAKGDEAQFNVDLGLMQEPPGLDRGLARAGQFLASARPDFARLRSVRLAILKLPPDGKGPSRAERWKQLSLQGRGRRPGERYPRTGRVLTPPRRCAPGAPARRSPLRTAPPLPRTRARRRWDNRGSYPRLRRCAACRRRARAPAAHDGDQPWRGRPTASIDDDVAGDLSSNTPSSELASSPHRAASLILRLPAPPG